MADNVFGRTEEPEYFIGEGLSESIQGNYDAAVDIFMQGHQRYPEDLEIQFFLIRATGEAARSRNNPALLKEIVTLWDSFIAAHPREKYSVSRGTADAYVERGVLKRSLGDSDGASEDFRKAREIDPKVLVP